MNFHVTKSEPVVSLCSNVASALPPSDLHKAHICAQNHRIGLLNICHKKKAQNLYLFFHPQKSLRIIYIWSIVILSVIMLTPPKLHLVGWRGNNLRSGRYRHSFNFRKGLRARYGLPNVKLNVAIVGTYPNHILNRGRRCNCQNCGVVFGPVTS